MKLPREGRLLVDRGGVACRVGPPCKFLGRLSQPVGLLACMCGALVCVLNVLVLCFVLLLGLWSVGSPSDLGEAVVVLVVPR